MSLPANPAREAEVAMRADGSEWSEPLRRCWSRRADRRDPTLRRLGSNDAFPDRESGESFESNVS
jgi:hypothetical protein